MMRDATQTYPLAVYFRPTRRVLSVSHGLSAAQAWDKQVLIRPPTVRLTGGLFVGLAGFAARPHPA